MTTRMWLPLLLAAPGIASAACPKPDIDPFTGAAFYELWETERVWMSDQGVLLDLSASSAGMRKEVVGLGSEMLVLLKDGTQLSLEVVDPADPVLHASYGAWTTWRAKYALTTAQIKALAGSRVDEFRLTVLGDAPFFLADRRARKIKKLMGCLEGTQVAYPPGHLL